MKKHVYIGITVIGVVIVGVLVFLASNHINLSRETIPPSNTQTSTEEPVNTDDVNAPTSTPTDISSPPLRETITREETREMFERNATFDELKDIYDLEIESESQNGRFLYAISNSIPYGGFNFMKNRDTNEFEILFIIIPAYMVLPEYVDMVIGEIPIIVEIPGQGDRATRLRLDGLEFLISAASRLSNLHPHALIAVSPIIEMED